MIKTINEEAIRHLTNIEEETSVTAGSLDTEAFYRRVERQRATSQQTASALNGSGPVSEYGTARAPVEPRTMGETGG